MFKKWVTGVCVGVLGGIRGIIAILLTIYVAFPIGFVDRAEGKRVEGCLWRWLWKQPPPVTRADWLRLNKYREKQCDKDNVGHGSHVVIKKLFSHCSTPHS